MVRSPKQPRRRLALRRAGVATIAGTVALCGSSIVMAKLSRHAMPRGGAYYGGGRINPKAEGHNPDNAFAVVRVSQNRKRVTASVSLYSRCHGPGITPAGDGFIHPVDVTGKVRADGSFSARSVTSSTGSAGTFSNTTTLVGRFVSAERVLATARSRGKGVTHPADSCDTGNVKVELNDAALPLGSGAFAHNAAYFGTNDSGPAKQVGSARGLSCVGCAPGAPLEKFAHWPMMLKTSSGARSVALLSYYYTTQKCQKSADYLTANELGPPPANVDRHGSFSEQDKFDEPVGGGYVAHVVATVHGRFSARRVAGTMRIDHAIAAPSGAIVDHCTTGDVHWSAAR